MLKFAHQTTAVRFSTAVCAVYLFLKNIFAILVSYFVVFWIAQELCFTTQILINVREVSVLSSFSRIFFMKKQRRGILAFKRILRLDFFMIWGFQTHEYCALEKNFAKVFNFKSCMLYVLVNSFCLTVQSATFAQIGISGENLHVHRLFLRKSFCHVAD